MEKLLKSITILAIIASLAGCSKSETPSASVEFFSMDTYMTITAYGKNAEEAVNSVKETILKAESLWSVTDENSEIYAINHSGGQTVSISEETEDIIRFELSMSENTNGALDPTIYPILLGWGFTADEFHVLTQDEIDPLLQLVDYKKVHLDEGNVTLPDGMMLDLGAVAKGYVADLAANQLANYGIESAIINLGGNVQTVGTKSDGSLWRVALQNPNGENYLGVLSLSDRAAVTSGGYERYFTDDDGNSYCHIIDPSTGMPVKNDLLSVTVIAKEGKLCDALSTSLFVMGSEKATAYWKEHRDFDMIYVTDSGIFVTQGIAEQFTAGSNEDKSIYIINTD